jgi:signal peptidase I
MKKFFKELLPYLIIILVVVVLRSYVITPVTVDGPSMQTTLYTNDVMLLYKFNKNNVKRYDIVVVKHGSDRLIKRLIGMPGDTIKCVSGIIYINNEEAEKYGYGNNMDFAAVKLSSDEYFVIGDNREDSFDSRYFGPINKDQMMGNVNFIFFPFNRFGIVK